MSMRDEIYDDYGIVQRRMDKVVVSIPKFNDNMIDFFVVLKDNNDIVFKSNGIYLYNEISYTDFMDWCLLPPIKQHQYVAELNLAQLQYLYSNNLINITEYNLTIAFIRNTLYSFEQYIKGEEIPPEKPKRKYKENRLPIKQKPHITYKTIELYGFKKAIQIAKERFKKRKEKRRAKKLQLQQEKRLMRQLKQEERELYE